MSPSDRASARSDRPWWLELASEDPTAELSVLDRLFAPQSSKPKGGYSLPTGLYTVSSRTPAGLREAHLELGETSRLIGEPDGVSLQQTKQGVTVTFESAALASPIPLAGTTRTREYHRDAASVLNADPVARTLGVGAELVIFSRAWSEDEQSCSGWHPLSGLSLADGEGLPLVDLHQASRCSGERDPWAGVKLGVRPGAYRLRQSTPRGKREICLHVPRGWQLHAYLLTTPSRVRPKALEQDLARLAVLLSRGAVDLDDTKRNWLLTEQARFALSELRPSLDLTRLNALFARTAESPMLGLYLAHLLLLSGNSARHFVRELVKRLRASVGPHPDVEAVALGCGLGVARTTTFNYPPTLRQSWQYALRETQRRPSLIPLKSQAAPVAAMLQAGHGPWLVCGKSERARPRSFLDTAERDLLNYWYASYRARASMEEGSPVDEPEATPEQLYDGPLRLEPRPEELRRLAMIESLGLPYSVLQAATTKLCLEMRHDPGSLGESPHQVFAAQAIRKLAPARLPDRVPDEQLMLRFRDVRDDAVLEALSVRHRELVLHVISMYVPEQREAARLARITFEQARNEAIPSGPAKAFVWLRALAAWLAVRYLLKKSSPTIIHFFRQLTERKQEVWRMREAELPHRQVADRLGISERTVQKHEAQLFSLLRNFLKGP
jgi:DNA-binding NarL/FixJ family response regulator